MAASVLRAHSQKIRVPSPEDKIYKEECLLCFDKPEFEEGLYVCLNLFWGFCRKHAELYIAKTSNSVFLHLKRCRREVEQKPPTENKPTKLAIGLEGGFDVASKKYEYDELNKVVILPDYYEIPLPCPDLPESVQLSITTILASDAASKMEEAAAMAGTWDGMQRDVTKHASSLVQLHNGVKVSPNNWSCKVCGLKENLWLNLTDGSIHCGRKYFNGLGGNNHAVEHYEKTKYPLVVKLGTITAETSDIYSYDEDAMVIDPNLPEHLSHFGINIQDLQKTDKSMVELEIDLNQRIGEWAIIQEVATRLVPLYGPGSTGLVNLGNSCYLNAVMQVVFVIPDFVACYYEKHDEILNKFSSSPAKDFNIQMAKLAHGLLSGEYSKEPAENSADEECVGIKPQMFKSLIGSGHPEFSTKRQQDAQEFFLHLISTIERHSRGRDNPSDALKFQMEDRLQCIQSGTVKYATRMDYLLSLPIPLETATNREDLEAYEAKKAEVLARGDRINPDEIVRPKIALTSCLKHFATAEILEDFYSPATQSKSTAYKTTRMQTFPDYLVIHLKKFTVDDNWVPKKLDVSMDVPEELDLSELRGKGMQPEEVAMPEPATVEEEFAYDDAVLLQLKDMGFPIDSCKRALYYTRNEGIDAAMNWVMEHMNDTDFADPFFPPGVKTENAVTEANPDAIAMIVAIGFTPSQATKALQATDNNVERAVDWIFSHVEELESEPVEMDTTPVPQLRDGSEKYQLVAFISHMGTSTLAGHYVCHILKNGHWVIFNDNKVALSEHPPKDLAYLYLYQRKSRT